MSNKYYEVNKISDHPERLALWHDLGANKWFWMKDDYLKGQTESISYPTKEDADKAQASDTISWTIN
jgi:hypothetical protein